jgi:hypothetical protein
LRLPLTDAPDYRSDPSESPEGRGIAYGRSAAFWKSLPESVRAEASHETTLTVSSIEDYPTFMHDQVTSTVVEDAELIGFWVAWHKAGGFAGLEAAGWHRATIYRKIRRFRARFGAHPDEHRFEWIKLDLKKAWNEDLEDFLHPFGRPDPA